MLRLLSLAMLVALSLALPGCSTRTATTPAPTGPAVTVKASDLMKEYGANAVAADAKYKGKLLQVSGKFGSAQKAPLMGYVVQVLPEDGSSSGLSDVQCFILESAQADVAKFETGKPITMKGTCDGQVVGQVKLSGCTVVK